MAWTRDTDYEPAYAHFGYAAAVFGNGIDSIVVPEQVARDVTGWRSACGCGWRGEQFYPRGEFPSRDGTPPETVEGYRQNVAAYAEWEVHLRRELPELEVYDLAKELGTVQRELNAALDEAKRAGVSQAQIVDVVRKAGARITFPDRGDGPASTVKDGPASAPRPAPHRRPDGPTPGRS